MGNGHENEKQVEWNKSTRKHNHATLAREMSLRAPVAVAFSNLNSNEHYKQGAQMSQYSFLLHEPDPFLREFKTPPS